MDGGNIQRTPKWIILMMTIMMSLSFPSATESDRKEDEDPEARPKVPPMKKRARKNVKFET